MPQTALRAFPSDQLASARAWTGVDLARDLPEAVVVSTTAARAAAGEEPVAPRPAPTPAPAPIHGAQPLPVTSSGRERTVDVQGVSIPRLGLGTWQLQGASCIDAVEHALALGYRHIDTAAMYDNETAVGTALRKSAVPRDEVFVTTKVWWQDAQPRDVRAAAHESLRRLGTDYVDLLLLHWPNEDVPLEDTLGEMARLREHGVARSIGVSNFPTDLLARALEVAPIVANQVEMHPFLDQRALLAMAQRHELALVAYSPLARGRVFDDAELRRLAERLRVSPSALTLAWLLSKPHVVAIPCSSDPGHQRDNLAALDLEVDPATLRALDSLAGDDRLIDPSFAPGWDEPGAQPASLGSVASSGD